MVALLLAMTMVVQDSGAFVVRLGNDTLSLEQYTRTATQLRGEYVIRTPRSLHRVYTLDLNPDGTVRRLQLVTDNIGGGPGPMASPASSSRPWCGKPWPRRCSPAGRPATLSPAAETIWRRRSC